MRYLAETYVATGQHEKAIHVYQKMLEKDPEDVAARIHLAQLFSWSKHYDEAIDEYVRVLKTTPDSLQAMQQLGDVYKLSHRFNEAESLYRECIQKHPNAIEAYVSLGELLTWERKYDEAISYFQLAIQQGETKDAELLLGRAILYSGNSERAKSIFLTILKRSPNDVDARRYLAESYSYSQEFTEAIPLYTALLRENPSLFLKKKLAEVLSWDKQYGASLALYDEILQEEYDVLIQVQKARVLGWAQEYTKAESEYKSILAKQYDQYIALELEGKVAYWDRDWILSEKKYVDLVSLKPENVEAWFDLSQIYSYRLQWQKAIDVYHKILFLEPNHFRAKRGLEKVKIISHDPSLAPTFKRFKALSPTRSTEINERQSLNALLIPINMTNTLHIESNIAKRHFFAYPNILEHQNVIGMTHLFGSESWINAYYGCIEYRRGRMHKRFESRAASEAAAISTSTSSSSKELRSDSTKLKRASSPFQYHKHKGASQSSIKKGGQHKASSTSIPTPPPAPPPPIPKLPNLLHKYFQYWGGTLSHRVSDLTALTFSYDKQRLENNSIVIVKGMYQNEYKGRVDLNCMRDLKVGLDYLYSRYSDNNRLYQPAADVVYFIHKDPQRLYVMYRYYWMNFKKIAVDYWSPQHLSTHCATIGWRQFLNKGEVFFGENNLYYDLKYEPSIDSTHVVENKFTGEVNWDITKRLTTNVRVVVLRSSHNVYRENSYSLGVKYYF